MPKEERGLTPEKDWCHNFKHSVNDKSNFSSRNDDIDTHVKITLKDEYEYLARLKLFRQKYKDKFNPQILPFYMQSVENFVKGKLKMQRENREYQRSSSNKNKRNYKYRSRSRSRSSSRFRNSRSLSSSLSRSQSPFERSKHARSKSRSLSPRRNRSKNRARSPKRDRSKNHSRSPKLSKKNEKESKSPKDTKHKSVSQTQKKNKQEKMDSLNEVSTANVLLDSATKTSDLPASNSFPVPDDQTSVSKIGMIDFKPSLKKEKFTKRNFKIYFTPCLKTLFGNIRLALQDLKFNDKMDELFFQMSVDEQTIVWRSLEALAFLVCGQSLIASVKTICGKSNVCTPLEKYTFSIFRPLHFIVSQYGEVQSELSPYICSIDHNSDIRAIIRLANQLVPESVPLENAVDRKEKLLENDFRFWLPTSNKDKRFLWILAGQINSLMNKKIGYAPSLRTIVDAFQRNAKPSWWNRQLSLCFTNVSVLELLDFLFTDYWTKETFYANFAENENSNSLLKQLGLDWEHPLPEHLDWEVDASQVVDRVFKICTDINEQFDSYNFPMVSQLFPRDHIGSWHQIQEKDTSLNFFGIGETDSNKRNLGMRYPPKAITEPLSIFYTDLDQ